MTIYVSIFLQIHRGCLPWHQIEDFPNRLVKCLVGLILYDHRKLNIFIENKTVSDNGFTSRAQSCKKGEEDPAQLC